MKNLTESGQTAPGHSLCWRVPSGHWFVLKGHKANRLGATSLKVEPFVETETATLLHHPQAKTPVLHKT